MKILVPVKRVPDPTQKAKIKDGHIDLTGASWIVNTFDEYAVETALRLLENGEADTAHAGGEIVVVSIGPEDAAKEIRTTLAMGADRAIHVVANDAEIDSLVVVKVLAGDHRGREARPRGHGQAGRRRRREPGRPDAGRQARLAAGDVRRVDRARRRQVAAPSAARSTAASSTSGAAAGGGHRRPAHRRPEGRARTASRRPRSPTRARARAAVAQGHHGGEEEADRRRRSSRDYGAEPQPVIKELSRHAAAAARRPVRSSPTSPTLVKKLPDEAKVL